MELTNQNTVESIDADFAKMAVEVGQHAWGITALTMREKAFVFVAADLCARSLGFALQTHVSMARSQGVPLSALREAVRHLAPYVGYPTAAEALMALARLEDDKDNTESPTAGEPVDLSTTVLGQLELLDNDFGSFYHQQFVDRWARPELSIRERALTTLATDVLNQTLDDSFALHLDIALSHGAEIEQIRAVLLLVAEFGITKSWRAYRALRDTLH